MSRVGAAPNEFRVAQDEAMDRAQDFLWKALADADRDEATLAAAGAAGLTGHVAAGTTNMGDGGVGAYGPALPLLGQAQRGYTVLRSSTASQPQQPHFDLAPPAPAAPTQKLILPHERPRFETSPTSTGFATTGLSPKASGVPLGVPPAFPREISAYMTVPEEARLLRQRLAAGGAEAGAFGGSEEDFALTVEAFGGHYLTYNSEEFLQALSAEQAAARAAGTSPTMSGHPGFVPVENFASGYYNNLDDVRQQEAAQHRLIVPSSSSSAPVQPLSPLGGESTMPSASAAGLPAHPAAIASRPSNMSDSRKSVIGLRKGGVRSSRVVTVSAVSAAGQPHLTSPGGSFVDAAPSVGIAAPVAEPVAPAAPPSSQAQQQTRYPSPGPAIGVGSGESWGPPNAYLQSHQKPLGREEKPAVEEESFEFDLSPEGSFVNDKGAYGDPMLATAAIDYGLLAGLDSPNERASDDLALLETGKLSTRPRPMALRGDLSNIIKAEYECMPTPKASVLLSTKSSQPAPPVIPKPLLVPKGNHYIDMVQRKDSQQRDSQVPTIDAGAALPTMTILDDSLSHNLGRPRSVSDPEFVAVAAARGPLAAPPRTNREVTPKEIRELEQPGVPVGPPKVPSMPARRGNFSNQAARPKTKAGPALAAGRPTLQTMGMFTDPKGVAGRPGGGPPRPSRPDQGTIRPGSPAQAGTFPSPGLPGGPPAATPAGPPVSRPSILPAGSTLANNPGAGPLVGRPSILPGGSATAMNAARPSILPAVKRQGGVNRGPTSPKVPPRATVNAVGPTSPKAAVVAPSPVAAITDTDQIFIRLKREFDSTPTSQTMHVKTIFPPTFPVVFKTLRLCTNWTVKECALFVADRMKFSSASRGGIGLKLSEFDQANEGSLKPASHDLPHLDWRGVLNPNSVVIDIAHLIKANDGVVEYGYHAFGQQGAANDNDEFAALPDDQRTTLGSGPDGWRESLHPGMWSQPELCSELSKRADSTIRKSQKPRWYVLQHNKLFTFLEAVDPAEIRRHLMAVKKKEKQNETAAAAAKPKPANPKGKKAEAAALPTKAQYELDSTDPQLNPEDIVYLLDAKIWTGSGKAPSGESRADAHLTKMREWVDPSESDDFSPRIKDPLVISILETVGQNSNRLTRLQCPDEQTHAVWLVALRQASTRAETQAHSVLHKFHVDERLAQRLGLQLQDLLSPKDPRRVFESATRIGSGGLASVFRARNRETKAVVALKVMKVTASSFRFIIKELLQHKALSQGFDLLENDDLSMAARDAVVEFRDAYYVASEGQMWIELEFMDVGSLTSSLSPKYWPGSGESDAVSESKAGTLKVAKLMPEPVIAYIAKCMLRALRWLHVSGRVHRDLKSDNVLLNSKGAVKLADLGFVADLGERVVNPGARVTRNSIVGTPYWMAPEVILGSSYGHEVDIWSFGVTLIECAQAVPPLFRVPPATATQQIAEKGLLPMSRTFADVTVWSNDFLDFLANCLAFEPANRSSASQLLDHPFISLADQIVPATVFASLPRPHG